MLNYNDLNHDVADYLSHRFDIEIEVTDGGLMIETEQFMYCKTLYHKQDVLLTFIEKVAEVVAKEFDAYVDYEFECGLLTLFIC